MRSDVGRGGFRAEVSHPCAGKNAQGWGTQRMRLVEISNADTAASRCFAQDDHLDLEGCR
jgi:hypothetical protein